MSFKSIEVFKGPGGWGKSLILTPTDKKRFIISVTGGGIHPVAEKMAQLSGAEVVDGFTNHVPDDQVLAAVINCGGTARIGVYPKKRIPTIDVYPGAPSGPLAQFITDDIFVSGVSSSEVNFASEDLKDLETGETDLPISSESSPKTLSSSISKPKGFTGFVVGFGNAIGFIINTLLSSGRQAIDIILKTVLPFMAYVGLLIGIVTYTGISDWLANVVTPLAANPFGLILLSVIVALPFLSPILGPGAAIAQVVGVLVGSQIGAGALPVQYALPTLFAINGQVGADFVPVGLSLGEAKPETISVGVPAVLFSRLITSPIAVIIAIGVSVFI